MGLYKNCDAVSNTNIEQQRVISQYFTIDHDTNSGAGREYVMPHQFEGSLEGLRIGRGYIKNDNAAGTLLVKLKFTMDFVTEAYVDEIEILPGDTLELYELPLISVIFIENVPGDAGLNLLFRVFAT